MRSYAIIPIEDYSDEMLNDVKYPVVTETLGFKMLEYNEQPDPIGEGWVFFKGDDSNVRCAEYLEDIEIRPEELINENPSWFSRTKDSIKNFFTGTGQ